MTITNASFTIYKNAAKAAELVAVLTEDDAASGYAVVEISAGRYAVAVSDEDGEFVFYL